MISFKTWTAVFMGTVASISSLPSYASGQSIAASTAPAVAAAATQAPAGPARQVTSGWQDGFLVQSGDGGFRLQLGLLAQADGRFALDDSNDAVVDAFVAKRLRPSLRGRVGQHFEFNFNPDFGNGTFVMQDAYLDTIFSPAFRIRVGKGKAPFGLERLHSASHLSFYDRALPRQSLRIVMSAFSSWATCPAVSSATASR